jgi:coenzyme F420-dependent glucose-6-phosphate dehydrogenase
MDYWVRLATERFPPSQLVDQAVEAERAGFDALNVSDHVLQTGFSWAEDDDKALEGARVWKATQPKEYFTDDWHDPREMYEKADREVSDDAFKQSYIVSSDPDHHTERIREIEGMGPTVVCLQNASGAYPLGALRTYRDRVLPALKGAHV